MQAVASQLKITSAMFMMNMNIVSGNCILIMLISIRQTFRPFVRMQIYIRNSRLFDL